MIRTSALLFILLYFLAACQHKDSPNPVIASAYEQHLASNAGKKWILTAWTTKIGSSFQNDFQTMESCDRDDITTFYTNKAFTITDGETSCDANRIKHSPGTWGFQNNDTELKMSVTGTTALANYKVKELTPTTMVLDPPLFVIAGDSVVTTYTFTAQ